jgi:hypothetical protein
VDLEHLELKWAIAVECGCFVLAGCLDSDNVHEAMIVWTLDLDSKWRCLLSYCND